MTLCLMLSFQFLYLQQVPVAGSGISRAVDTAVPHLSTALQHAFVEVAVDVLVTFDELS